MEEKKDKQKLTVEEAGQMGGKREQELVREGREYENKVEKKTEREMENMDEME